jgi:hypothetical protein
MAAHRYVRHTEDVDLGVSIAVQDLARVASNLQATGYEVVCREPDGQDPLGGVIDVSGNFGLVQVVNFGERFPAIIESGLAEATLRTRVNGSLRIAPLPHLVGLKLYAGRMKSKADIVELLRCNPSADRDVIRDLCRRYRLRGLDPLIQEADADVRTSAPGSPGKPLTTNPPNPRSPPATFDTSFRRDGRPLGRGSPRAGSGRARAISPDARYGHPCPSLARGKPRFRHPGCARFPNAGSIGTGPPLANPYSDSARVAAIEAPRREPVGRRAVGLFPLPIPANRSPPQRPIRDHHRDTASLRVAPGRVGFSQDISPSGEPVDATSDAVAHACRPGADGG